METAKIYNIIEGHTDSSTGEWVEAGEELIATVEASRQPKSGSQRANEMQTEYESEYIAIIMEEDITFETGFDEIAQGYIYEDSNENRYDIVFPGHWVDSHYELELKVR